MMKFKMVFYEVTIWIYNEIFKIAINEILFFDNLMKFRFFKFFLMFQSLSFIKFYNNYI